MAERFAASSVFLRDWAPIWSTPVFAMHDGGWFTDLPEVARWIDGDGRCSDTTTNAASHRCAEELDILDAFESGAGGVGLPAVLLELSRAARRLCALSPIAKGAQRVSVRPRDARFLSEHKWRQVVRFIEALPPLTAGASYADWCAGKGHLARTLSLTASIGVTRLERDPDLCAEGTRLAEKMGASSPAAAVDVMTDTVFDHIDASTHVLALHACGALHRRLIRIARAGRVVGISLAPCCYPLTDELPYAPLSTAGRSEGLRLEIEALRLAVRGARDPLGRRARRQRRAQAWRIAFDLLRRERTGASSYTSQPSLPDSAFGGTFRDFAQRLARQIGLDLGPLTDVESAEAEGYRRLARVRRAEMVTAIFSRPLELWLVTDLALALTESGLQVELGTFCDSATTPRNLLLNASADPRLLTSKTYASWR
ncbi:MAG: methyltransferase [Myxococcales bacterium]|nr:methyltransferase [Myxococcales bacterium]